MGRMRANDTLFLLMGVAIVVYGVKVVSHPEYESWRFGHINFGEHHQLIGAVIVVLGVAAIYSVFRKR